MINNAQLVLAIAQVTNRPIRDVALDLAGKSELNYDANDKKKKKFFKRSK